MKARRGGIREFVAGLGSAPRRLVGRRGTSRPDEWEFNLWRWFVVAFGAIAAAMLFMARNYYFGTPLFETGDLAANSLQISRAAHLLEIYGNYSRFQFHHPGPAFFYVYAAGEVIFYNLLHLVPAPHNGHLLAGALLQSAFLAATIAVAARFAAPNRRFFVVAAILVALVHFQLAGNPEFSLWPPEQLVVPFACFLVVAAAVATGWLALLPLLVVCGGFLVHGHVAQPLYVVPISSIALGVGTWTGFHRNPQTLRAFVRSCAKPLGLALSILLIFLIPLFLDALRGTNSNLSLIVTNLAAPRLAADMHSPGHVVGYIFSFLGYPLDLQVLDFSAAQLGTFAVAHWPGIVVSVTGLVLLPIALLVTRIHRKSSTGTPEGSSFVPASYGVIAVAVALTLVWVEIQRGPLFEFNSFFVYGLMFAAILPPLVVFCRQNRPVMTGPAVIVGVVAIALVVATALPLPGGEDQGGQAVNDAVKIVVAERSGSDAVLLSFESDEWPQAVAIALALERSNVPWYVAPDWGFMFGADHVYVPGPGSPSSPEKWFLTPPAAGNTGQIVLTPRVAIYPAPPSLAAQAHGH